MPAEFEKSQIPPNTHQQIAPISKALSSLSPLSSIVASVDDSIKNGLEASRDLWRKQRPDDLNALFEMVGDKFNEATILQLQARMAAGTLSSVATVLAPKRRTACLRRTPASGKSVNASLDNQAGLGVTSAPTRRQVDPLRG